MVKLANLAVDQVLQEAPESMAAVIVTVLLPRIVARLASLAAVTRLASPEEAAVARLASLVVKTWTRSMVVTVIVEIPVPLQVRQVLPTTVASPTQAQAPR